MNWASISGVVLIIFIIVADIVLMLRKSSNSATTWSEILRVGFWYTTAVPWGLAVWIGHWFPVVDKPPFQASAVVVLAVSIAWVAGWDILKRKVKYQIVSNLAVSLSVVAGLIVGAIFWPITTVTS